MILQDFMRDAPNLEFFGEEQKYTYNIKQDYGLQNVAEKKKHKDF